MPEYPILAGWIAGTLEISVTFPFEYVKTQFQLQQEASALFAGADKYRSSWHCTVETVKRYGVSGLYTGGQSWALFAGPRSAVRFWTFDTLTKIAGENNLPSQYGKATVDTVNGFAAGTMEAALCQTPNQVIGIKMIQDRSPRGPKRYSGITHCMATMWRADGLPGFFQGLGPAVLKGAATNAIRFVGYGHIKRAIQGDDTSKPLSVWQSMLAGGTAGAISAVATQPIDTIKANMMGLEAKRFHSSFACAADLVRAGGPLVLFNGLGPRVTRVFIEVALQFSLYELIGRQLDQMLSKKLE